MSPKDKLKRDLNINDHVAYASSGRYPSIYYKIIEEISPKGKLKFKNDNDKLNNGWYNPHRCIKIEKI